MCRATAVAALISSFGRNNRTGDPCPVLFSLFLPLRQLVGFPRRQPLQSVTQFQIIKICSFLNYSSPTIYTEAKTRKKYLHKLAIMTECRQNSNEAESVRFQIFSRTEEKLSSPVGAIQGWKGGKKMKLLSRLCTGRSSTWKTSERETFFWCCRGGWNGSKKKSLPGEE